MTNFFERHRDLLERAVQAWRTREFWTPFPETPSTKLYGADARRDGHAAYEALLGAAFALPGHPEAARLGSERSPWGQDLAIRYPVAPPEALIAASQAAGATWGQAPMQARVGALIEALIRLNRMSFLIGEATMHATGQAFPMAFQAGGPHAQDRGLEAIAAAWIEMTATAQMALWEKPQGKSDPLVIEKQWHLVPRGVALAIGCNTFPTWNSYPGLFASLATGNTVMVKPHPQAILPLALTVKVLREVFAEAGLPQDAVLLAVDAPGDEITKPLARDPAVAIIDYTGSSGFADWLREHATQAIVFTEETGVNPVTITGTDDFEGMCANLAFSLSLYSGQMCTSPQNIYIPRAGIATDEGHKSFDAVVAGIVAAIDCLLADPQAAAAICGTIVNPATLEHVAAARHAGQVVRQSGETGAGRSATPLVVVIEGDGPGPQDDECFGPVSFVIPCEDAQDAIARASGIAARKGAITAALYTQGPELIAPAAQAFAVAGVNLSVNLTGNIYVNQSAAFSDFHVTGANPAGNASLTDTAFVAPRFRRVMIRWPKAA
ncbi:aldehyde dehydrogenase [Thioclava dalianensis]|uniref:Aldehyde dehydrogenase n=1 Tax=Thioclava dalianensis TaxID=1185766 RepID=A0A074TE43_9RHOB|nr:phenylacetic acid degradation protein PaaN [Thioclava dalianensis]KEP69964.1 aldehyde dehydrogenase [Thioclava dalianensis]SFN18227.1 phenylacetic acid degradation protein paaN [Thioclava dalianensis]